MTATERRAREAALQAQDERDEAQERLAEERLHRETIADVYADCSEELKEALALAARLRDALQDLVDWQTGPPLPKYAAGWGVAMKQAVSILGEPAVKLLERKEEAEQEWVCKTCGGIGHHCLYKVAPKN